MRGALLVLVGCGRLNFEPLDSPPTVGAPCIDETFDTTTPAFTGDYWDVVDGAGPDGSPALVTTAQGDAYAYAPSIGPARALDLEVDMQLDDVTVGDFGVLLLGRTFGDPAYSAGLVPVGSDSPEDLLRQQNPTADLDIAAPVLTAGWHHIRFRYTGDAIDVFVDDELQLSASDLTFLPSFEILIGIYATGRIDNVAIHCTRL